jgi:hypothetical protein
LPTIPAYTRAKDSLTAVRYPTRYLSQISESTIPPQRDFYCAPLSLRTGKPLPTLNFTNKRSHQCLRTTSATPITDQEIVFARLGLSGSMTDRRAAEAAGLHPDSAAYTKSKPRVRAYMLEHRAAVQQQLVEQDTDGLRRLHLSRDQVLARLWELAHLSPEITRGSISGQVKALSMIIAIEGLIPDRRAASAQNKSAPPPVTAQIYEAAWLRTRQSGENPDPQPPPPPAQEEAASEPPSPPGWANGAPPISGAAPGPIPEPTPDVSEPTVFAAPVNPAQRASSALRVPMADYFAPDTRVPFSIKKNLFARRR